jgi:hypothetical protein
MTAITYYPGYSQVQVADNYIWQVISAITNSNPMVVTTVNNSNYNAGMMVTFNIPSNFGMRQLNGLNIQVTNVSGTSITCNIDSTNFTPFAAPSPLPSAYTSPTIIPNTSGPYLAPLPLPYGNQNSLIGTIFNAGQI